VLQLYDTATGQTGPVQPIRPGELRIWVTAPVPIAAGLRRCLIADMLRRVAERHHLRVTTWYQASGSGASNDSGTKGLAELNIYPAELAAAPPHPLDLAVAPELATPEPVTAEPVSAGASSPTLVIQPGELAADGLDGLDPLALRLALLELPYREPAVVGRQALEAAGRTLQHWRGLVADWANSPSKAMCAQYTGDVHSALDDDLDTPAALRTMHALAGDDELPPGSRFEAFAYLDQLLGLDLARDVGR
jgi:hypothetical protein